MAYDIYCSHIEGTKQTGAWKGSCLQEGREGWVHGQTFRHEVIAPRDASSGKPQGKREHKPCFFTFELDQSTPNWYMALYGNENLPKVQFKFFVAQTGEDRTTGDTSEKDYWTIDLVNATICSIEMVSPNSRVPGNKDIPEYLICGIAYQKITQTWKDGGRTAEDNWLSPKK